MKSAKDLLLILSSITFTVVLGAAIYEHASVIPQWSEALPASLAMFQGEYGLKAVNFWVPIHPVALLIMIGALVANWNTARKKNILTVLIGYILILVITYIYFVPVLIGFMETPYQDTVDQELVNKASVWETLSLVRLVFIFILCYILISSLTRSNAKIREIAP